MKEYCCLIDLMLHWLLGLFVIHYHLSIYNEMFLLLGFFILFIVVMYNDEMKKERTNPPLMDIQSFWLCFVFYLQKLYVDYNRT